MRDSDELAERKRKLYKVIDQGSKLEQLYSQEEFQFFLGWINRKLKINDDKILNGAFLNDKDEWLAKGRHTALIEIIAGAETFADRAKIARKTLKKLEDDLKNEA